MKWQERSREQRVTIALSCAAVLLLATATAATVYAHSKNGGEPLKRTIQQPPTPVYDSKHIPKIGKTLVATINGKGNQTIKTFTAPQYWNVYWYYQCEIEQTNSFKITPVGLGASAHNKLEVLTGPGESAYGNGQYTTAGTYKLVVTSSPSCDWKITVKTTQ